MRANLRDGRALLRARAGAADRSPAAVCITPRQATRSIGFADARTAFRSPKRRPARARCRHDHPLQPRRDRRHRHSGGEPGGGGGRCDPRGRHAAAGLHHRVVGAVPQSGAPADRAERAAVRRRQASTRCRWSPTRGRGWRHWRTALGRLSRAGGLDAGDCAGGDGGRGARRPRRHRAGQRASCRRTRR